MKSYFRIVFFFNVFLNCTLHIEFNLNVKLNVEFKLATQTFLEEKFLLEKIYQVITILISYEKL